MKHLVVFVAILILSFGRDNAFKSYSTLNRHRNAQVRLFDQPWSFADYLESTTAKQNKLVQAVHPKELSYTYTAISFFNFVDKSKLVIEQEKVKAITASMKETLEDLGVRGTLLISDEGYNAQLAINTALLAKAYESIVKVDETLFSGLDWNVGKTLAYHPDEFLTEYERQQKEKLERYMKNEDKSDEFDHLARGFPFKKLIVKPKFAVLTDRMEGGEEIDWTDAGPELEPADWHDELSSAERPPLLLDCRNLYESEMGTFEGSIPLNTDKFSQSWEKLDELLEDVPKDQRVLTFCTGGIRCVKVNAYLKQKLGLQNIGRLKKGIIGYEQWLEEASEENEESFEVVSPSKPAKNLFTGTNFLFDRRRLSPSSQAEETQETNQ